MCRASRDGFSAEDFHDKGTGRKNTLTVILTTNGNVFGGFTEKHWIGNKDGINVYDPNAFIFSLINKDNKPFKTKISSNFAHSAVHIRNDCGPSFGGNHDSRLFHLNYEIFNNKLNLKKNRLISMFEIDQLKNLFNCDQCNQLLVDPV